MCRNGVIMKKFLKSKKAFILVGILIFIIILACLFCFTNQKEEQKSMNNEESYIAYIKINPFVKVSFNITDNCNDKFNCRDFTSNVTDISLLNEDAKSLYKDLDYKNKSLEELISSLISIAKEKNISTANVDITTNWPNNKDIISSKLSIDNETDFSITYQADINEEEILQAYEKKYAVTFDSDGGSKVKPQNILENESVTKPSNPTKEGYTFLEWQLNGETYDWNSKVNGNITLKAVWQKNNEEINNSNNSSTSKENEVSQKEKDNEVLRQQLKEKGLTWDFNTEEEAYNLLDKWSGGYGGDVIKNSYGMSDIAYTVKITLNTAACGGTEILNIDWHNETPIDFIYYLHSKGYNCSGNEGYYNGKHFTINQNNELIYD